MLVTCFHIYAGVPLDTAGRVWRKSSVQERRSVSELARMSSASKHACMRHGTWTRSLSLCRRSVSVL